MTEPLLSIVIPIKNEEATIPGLAAEVDRAMASVKYPWEVVWIDDGSTDGSLSLLRMLPSPHRSITFDRNHGQSAAFMAGFLHARGTWIGTIDGDGQNDPADLPLQLEHALASGADMVNGIRARRQDGFIRKLSSKIGNGARNWLTKETVSDVGCSTRVVKREALVQLPFFHGMHRFLPTLVRMRGCAIVEIPVNHRPRAGGRSKYGINNRLWSGLRDIFGVRWLQSRHRAWKIADGTGQKL
jgi:dolichol-phosphate mannosyltransferase